MPFNPAKIKSKSVVTAVPFEYCAAKTTAKGKPGTTVLDHCKNVGYVASELITLLPESVKALLSSNPALSASVHDVGKISPGYELKYFADTIVKQYAPDLVGQTSFCTHHAAISAAAIDRLLGTTRMASSASIAAAAHHGSADRSYPPDMAEVLGGESWAEERCKLIAVLTTLFGGTLKEADNANPSLLAGLTCVSDWIGSDEEFFPADGPPISDGDPAKTARHALELCGFYPSSMKRGLTFKDIFDDLAPYDAQKEFIKRVERPGVYVMEAPMGIGKTEAALYATYRLMEAGHHHGFYFALPTRLTSDRIHKRVAKFLGRITETPRAPRLAHGTAWLSAYSRGGEAFAPGQSWFNPMKRALLYPYAVGTIDQALLGVLNVRHSFVRLFGLAGKVVILDEVHSYDIYTGTLLDELVRRLQSIGCTVIILSATLTAKRRNQIVSGMEGLEDVDNYPLVTGKPEDAAPFAAVLPAPAENKFQISMEAWDNTRVAEEAVKAARKGKCVVCIANTVARAQAWYKAAIAERTQDEFEMGILHARFPSARREEIEHRWMEALGKETKSRPNGCLLIATQILEQSVDIDADWMISELAPSDMLLQRMGRLWRHSRDSRPCARAEMVITTQDPSRSKTRDEVRDVLGKENCLVYAPYVLMRTYSVWKPRNEVKLPSDIRDVIEATYVDARDLEGELMTELREQLEHKSERLRKLACSAQDNVRGIPTGPDDEHAATRYSDLPTRTVLLLALAEEMSGRNDQAEVRMLDGTALRLDKWNSNFEATKLLHANTVSIGSHLLPERGNVGQHCEWLDRHFNDTPIVLIWDEGGGRLSCFKGPETDLGYSQEYGIYSYGQPSSYAKGHFDPKNEDDACDLIDENW